MAGTQTFPTVPSAGSGGGAAATFAGMFGDGADGDYTVLAGATLIPGRERQYNNLTVQGTGVVTPLGFKLYVANTLTNAGLIHDDGANGDFSSSGGGLIAAQFIRGSSGGGVNGRSTAGVGNSAAGIGTTSYNNIGLAPSGGNGGAAGGNAGGTGGVATVTNIRWGGTLFWPRAATSAFNGGGGGGSGGCLPNTGSANSGGGGGGGGVVWIAAKTIANAGGTISARGGAGGIGSGSGDGVAGGGGGGGGGLVGILTTTPTGSIGGTVTAAGGAGGIGFGGGVAGSNGVSGSVNIIVFA